MYNKHLLSFICIVVIAGSSCSSGKYDLPKGEQKLQLISKKQSSLSDKRDRVNLKTASSGDARKVPGSERFSIILKSFDGDTVSISPNGDTEKKAAKLSKIFGGGYVLVPKNIKAELSIFSIGDLSILDGAFVKVAKHSRCGATLVNGTAVLKGPSQSKGDCFFYTPDIAVSAVKSSALISVTADGFTRMAAITGTIEYFNANGDSFTLEKGKEIIIDPHKDTHKAKDQKLDNLEKLTDIYKKWSVNKNKIKAAAARQKLFDKVFAVAVKRRGKIEKHIEKVLTIKKVKEKLKLQRQIVKHSEQDEKLKKIIALQKEKAKEQRQARRFSLICMNLLDASLSKAEYLYKYLYKPETINEKSKEKLRELTEELKNLSEKLPLIFNRPARSIGKKRKVFKLKPIPVR